MRVHRPADAMYLDTVQITYGTLLLQMDKVLHSMGGGSSEFLSLPCLRVSFPPTIHLSSALAQCSNPLDLLNR